MEIPMAGQPAGAPPEPSGAPGAPTNQDLNALVKEHDLVLFMKGTPEAPQCGFSARAAGVLQQLGRPFHAVNVFTLGQDPWQTVQTLAAWAQFPTLPQVWVKGELIGGSDIAIEMYESGELEDMLGS